MKIQVSSKDYLADPRSTTKLTEKYDHVEIVDERGLVVMVIHSHKSTERLLDAPSEDEVKLRELAKFAKLYYKEYCYAKNNSASDLESLVVHYLEELNRIAESISEQDVESE